MKDIRFLPLLLLPIGFCASCSRSLTDYGYAGGSDKTVDMSTIGPTYNEYPHMQQYPSYNYLPFETRHYLPTNKSIYSIPNPKLHTLGKFERKGLTFIQNFYTDLDNHFNPSKFQKKYAKVLSPEVETAIKQVFISDTTDIRHYWQAFECPHGALSGKRFAINYVGDNWYAVMPLANLELSVLIQLRPNSKGTGFLITGLKNESRGIDIDD